MDEISPQPEAASAPPRDVADADLETIRKTVEDAAGVSGGLWISYLLTLFYFAVAASSVTQADLFLETPVKAPFLGIELPLTAFFTLAPLMFITIHAYTLIYFVMLSEKAKWYHSELRRQIPGDDDSDAGRMAAATRNRLRRRLPGNIFVQFLAGPDDVRQSAFGWLLKIVAWSSLVIAPILLLLLMQVKFLPYHDASVLWLIRIVLAADLLLVWWLWHAILLGRGPVAKTRSWAASVAPYLGALLSAVVIVFSWTAVTFPGEGLGEALPGWRFLPAADAGGHTITVSLHEFLFHRVVDPTSRRRPWLSDTLVVPSLDVAQRLKVDEDKKAQTQVFVFSAQGRDLRGAVFDLSNLSKVDFRHADLQGASFFRTQILGSVLLCADLQKASFRLAQMQGASFRAARLEDSDFTDTQGAGAFFDGAAMTGANMGGAALQGASFNSVDLRGVKMINTTLDGATFGRRFERTDDCANPAVPTSDLGSVDLTNASLEATSFKDARLVHAILEGAKIDGADFSNAVFERADLPEQTMATATVRLGGATWQQGRSIAQDAAGGAGPSQTTPVLAKIDPYETTLAAIFRRLTCPGDLNSLYVLRGLVANERLADVTHEAASLIDPMLDKQCIASSFLTDFDRANLYAARGKYATERPSK